MPKRGSTKSTARVSDDPVWRLMALHTKDRREAEEILFPLEPSSTGPGQPLDGAQEPDTIAEAIEGAVSAFIDLMDDGICRGVDEVQLDVRLGEVIALALRGRNRLRGRPPMTTREEVLRAATITYAEGIAEALVRQGIRIGEARRQAAEQASVRAYRSGDPVAVSTLVKLMKIRAANIKHAKSRIKVPDSPG